MFRGLLLYLSAVLHACSAAMVGVAKLGCLVAVLHQIRTAESRNLAQSNTTSSSWDSISRPLALPSESSSAFVPKLSHESSSAVPDVALQRGESREASGFWSPSLMSVLRDAWNGETGDHKDLWPLDWRDVVTFVVAVLALFIAAGGGIGGGGVLVPLFILVLGTAFYSDSLFGAIRTSGYQIMLPCTRMASFERHQALLQRL